MPASVTRWRLALAALAVLGAMAGLVAMNEFPVGPVVDDAMYVVLAKSLATGHGYRSLNLPGAPFNTHFPPGYPAVLSVLWRLYPSFPANLALFKAFNALCLGAIAVGSARLVQARGLSRGWSFAFGVVVAFSAPLMILSAVLLSEPFFLALLLLLLPSLERLAGEADSAPVDAWRAAGCGLGIGLVTLVRSHGIVLVPAVLLGLVRKRRWRDAALVTIAAMICLVPWQLWIARHSGTAPAPLLGEYDSYTAWWIRGIQTRGWGMVAQTLARTVPETTQMFEILFSPVRGRIAYLATALALGALAAVGAATAARRAPVTFVFMAGYLAIVAVWPFQPSRFVWGIWPLLLATVLAGALRAGTFSHDWRHPVRLASAAAFCWILAGYSAYEWRAVRGRWWLSIPRAAVSHIQFAVGWTRVNSAPSDVIATEDEAQVYLYTGRRTLPVRAFTVAEYLEDEAAEKMAREGLAPLLDLYRVHAVLTYTRDADDIARLLSTPPSARLFPVGRYPGGAAYIVRDPPRS